ncbi:cycloheximide resistance [Paramyrothecium foliicola]|nr:cycloheximide resistance [Paramyrothecium foliicola]
MLGNAYAAGLSPLLPMIMTDFRINSEQGSQLVTYVLLTLGISNIFALPAASLFNKRYTILTSLLFFMLACIWSAEATTFNSLWTSRILGGLAGGLIEALGPSIVIETFPEHQLARAMVVYVGLLAAGSSLGPLAAGAIATEYGDWRWFLRILAMVIGLNLVSSLVMFPETTHDDQGPVAGHQQNLNDENQASEPQAVGGEETIKSSGSTASRTLESDRDVAILSLKQQWVLRSWSLQYVNLDWKNALLSFCQPFQLFILPQILVATLLFGLTIGWTVLSSIIISATYGSPPFLWDARSIGNLNAGPLIGLILGLPFGGVLADFLSNRATQKRGGRHNPRARLPAIVFGAVISPAGCVLLGYGLKDPQSWALVTVGWGMLSFGLTSSANVLLAYSVDTASHLASHIGALVNLTKNCLGFGVSYASVSWMAAIGPVGQFGTMAGLLWFAYLLVIPVWIYNDVLIQLSGKILG